jgi:hypothetical protein
MLSLAVIAGNEQKAKLFLPAAQTQWVSHYLPTSC